MNATDSYPSYQDQIRNLHHRRVYHITLVAGILILLFGVLDYVLVPNYYQEFTGYRLVAAIASLTLLLVNYLDKRKDYAVYVGFFQFLVISTLILAMIHKMGGSSSPYYVGLIVAITLYAALSPLTAVQTLFSGFLITFCYGLALQVTAPKAISYSEEVFNNLFFMICFVLIAATRSWAETVGRKKEIALRGQEVKANENLAKQAVILEEEVRRRTQEHAALEKRYRLLFEQIADDVVVLDGEGRVLQANDSFQRHYIDNAKLRSPAFDKCVVHSQRHILKNLMANILATGHSQQACKLTLKKHDQSHCDTEINLSLVKAGDPEQGILLVIRDIGTRKLLEERLRVSLDLKKRTESAAIMALAKLSEYRDVTPGKHLERIREYCRILAIQLSRHGDFVKTITPDFIQDIYHASILHDIGKVSIPDRLMNPSTVLTEEEEATIRDHTKIGGEVILEMEKESNTHGFLSMAKDIAYFHHERWDGNGYPKGLCENEIPLAARIMSVADAYEEATNHSTNGNSLHDEAVTKITNASEFSFDPRIVEAFFLRQEEFKLIRRKFGEAGSGG